MTCCEHCEDSQDLFSRRTARRDLRRYRRKGARSSTAMLVGALRPLADGASLLDVGGGVGPIQHELFREGLAQATQIDASEAYIEKSAEEARRRGNVDRVTYRHADFVDVAADVAPADIVTLDRVVCCYPDVESLVSRSASKARQVYGLVLPRDRWLVRVMATLGNTYLRLRRSAFRTYLHPREKVDEIVRQAGLALEFEGETVMWQVVTYRRIVTEPA